MESRQYKVTGMSCAACQARVEKAVSSVQGVDACSVSLLTNSMMVEGNAPDRIIIKAVSDAGYGAELIDGSARISADSFKDTETPKLIRRLIISAVLSAVVFVLCMMKQYPLLQAVIAFAVMAVNYRFFVNGFKGAVHLAPNMDTLVALGSLASFIYGYYDSAAMIPALITVGKTLEARSKGKTTNAIKSLLKLVPQVDIKPGEEFELRPGESVPADGTVLDGISAVDESALTGESVPVDKEPGSKVSAGTINKSGYLKCRATKVGNDTALGQIIKMVSDASSTKAPIAKIADKVSGVFVPVVILIALITIAVWFVFSGEGFGYCLSRGISVLVISCPCALGLATPVAIMVGSGKGAKNGILFKTAVSLEQVGKTDTVVLDKTGTITSGHPAVTDIVCEPDFTETELISLAYALEQKSEHPFAEAIIKYADSDKDLAGAAADIDEVRNFRALSGNGVEAEINGISAYAGSRRFVECRIEISNAIKEKCDSFSEDGKTPLLFVKDNRLAGIIAVADEIKADSAAAVSQLKQLGLKVIMLTGDNERTAQAIGTLAGVDQVIAGVLPEGKAEAIIELQKSGKVLMVGDGINDAPALTRADMGIAIGTGTDVAIDAADVVLMKSSLPDVPAAVRLSRKVLKNIYENLFWAFFYNIIGIPLAAGVWIPLFGWEINPVFCAAAMSLSSFCVVSNALRLNLFDVYDSSKDRSLRKKPVKEIRGAAGGISDKEKETSIMYKTTVEVTGMMCPMCEKHTNEAVQKAFEVIEVISSHDENKTVIKSAEKLNEAKLAEVINAAGYKAGKMTVEEIQ